MTKKEQVVYWSIIGVSILTIIILASILVIRSSQPKGPTPWEVLLNPFSEDGWAEARRELGLPPAPVHEEPEEEEMSVEEINAEIEYDTADVADEAHFQLEQMEAERRAREEEEAYRRRQAKREKEIAMIDFRIREIEREEQRQHELEIARVHAAAIEEAARVQALAETARAEAELAAARAQAQATRNAAALQTAAIDHAAAVASTDRALTRAAIDDQTVAVWGVARNVDGVAGEISRLRY